MAAPIEFSPNSPLGDALVILGAAGLVIPLFARFRITPVIGFILVGLLVGPSGLGGWVRDVPWLAYVSISEPDRLQPFAEFGIVMLLFSVGLELSFNRLWAMRKQVFGLGALELILCAAALSAIFYFGGMAGSTALALGLALAMSSTALVLKITDSRTPVGRAALSMLLFEDIALVPIIFLLGALAPRASEGGVEALLSTLALGTAVIAALLVSGRYLLPYLFAQAARTKSPELFLAASLLVVIVASLATAAVGLSPIVGALVAGLLIAETEYHGEVETITEPFKGLALGVFLITVGMSLNLAFLWENLAKVVLTTASVLLLKAGITGLLLRLMGGRTGTATETGVLMASPSETTLIVLTAAAAAQLIDHETQQFWQIVTAIGLTITPVMALLGNRLGRRVDAAAPLQIAASGGAAGEDGPRAIIIGFGRVGRLVADMLAAHDKPFVTIDSDADNIAAASAKGYAAAFGNAERTGTLEMLGIEQATAVILTMDEPVMAQRLVRKVHRAHPDLTIIARARDAAHAAALYRAGASHAVPETLEASLQLSEAVLVDLGVPMGFVIASIHEKRDEFREQIMEEGELDEKPRLKTSTLRERAV